MKEFEGDRAKMSLYIGETKQNHLDFRLDENALKSFSWVRWGYKKEELVFELERQYKSYFKSYKEILGKFSINIQ